MTRKVATNGKGFVLPVYRWFEEGGRKTMNEKGHKRNESRRLRDLSLYLSLLAVTHSYCYHLGPIRQSMLRTFFIGCWLIPSLSIIPWASHILRSLPIFLFFLHLFFFCLHFCMFYCLFYCLHHSYSHFTHCIVIHIREPLTHCIFQTRTKSPSFLPFPSIIKVVISVKSVYLAIYNGISTTVIS